MLKRTFCAKPRPDFCLGHFFGGGWWEETAQAEVVNWIPSPGAEGLADISS